MRMHNGTKKQLTVYVSPWGKEWIIHLEAEPPISIHETKAQAIRAAKALLSSVPHGNNSEIIVKKKGAAFQLD